MMRLLPIISAFHMKHRVHTNNFVIIIHRLFNILLHETNDIKLSEMRAQTPVSDFKPSIQESMYVTGFGGNNICF